jgi:hypothetical protein
MEEIKIVTTHEKPPVPVRIWDWEACLEDWDLDDPIGYGETEQDAIEDLLEKLELPATTKYTTA